MTKFIDFIKKYKYVFLIVAINLLIVATNYVPGKWLSGWDNLHPEFNFSINLKRVFLSSWEKFQGLGLPSGMAHTSDLPRLLILWILNFVFPTSSLRMIWQFFMLITGSLGMYFFLLKFVFRSTQNSYKKLFSFLGALFYLLNLGMLQNFYAPQSMFTTQYGFLPLLFLFAFNYLFNFKKKSLFWFALISFLASTQAYTPTLILAFFIFLGIGCLFFLIEQGFSFESVKRVFVFGIVLIFINAYWLFPVLYYIFTKAGTVPNASINIFTSEDSFLLNKVYGNFANTAILKGFWFGNNDYSTVRGNFYPMFGSWGEHISKIPVLIIGYTLSLVVLLGAISTFIKKSIKHRFLYLSFSLISVFFLMNANPPFGFIFTFLQENVPLFKEALRFPFTKFSNLATFSYAIVFSLGIFFISEFIEAKKRFLPVLSVLAVLFMGTWMFPLFKGNLFSENLVLDIPNEYFELFEWFEDKDTDARVLNLPINNYWAWPYYKWGYRGSGFIWYGFEQPLIDRAFDVWNYKNEEVYWQTANALSNSDLSELVNILEKYDIRYLLVDESVFIPNNPNQDEILKTEIILNKLGEDPLFTKEFSSDNLHVFEYKDYNSFVEAAENIPVRVGLEKSAEIYRDDPYYRKYGNYISSTTGEIKNIYNELFFKDNIGNFSSQPFNLDRINIDTKFIARDGDLLTLPSVFSTKSTVPVEITMVSPRLIRLDIVPIRVSLNNEQIHSYTNEVFINLPIDVREGMAVSIGDLVFSISAQSGYLGNGYIKLSDDLEVSVYGGVVEEVDLSKLLGSSRLSSCSSSGEGSYYLEKNESSLKLGSENNIACVFRDLNISGIKNNSLINISFDFDSENTYPRYCLFSNSSEYCLNDLEKYSNLSTKGSVEDLVKADGSNLSFYLYSYTRPDSASSIDYSNIKLKIYEQLYTKSALSGVPIDSTSKTFDVGLGENKMSVSYPVLKDSNLVKRQDFLNSGFIYRSDCSSSNIELSNNKDGYVVLEDKNNESCLYFEYPHLPRDQYYLVGFEHLKKLGKDQKMCVLESSTSRCFLPYKIDSPEDVWTKHNLLVPSSNSNKSGLAFIFYNLSLGKSELAENYYNSFYLYPVSYNLLSNFHLISQDLLSETKASFEPVEYSSGIYWFKTKEFNAKLLKISQSYDPGWVAFCGFKPCDANHVVVNNWANGWVFDDIGQEKDIIIVFWPQILQYIGFILVFGTLSLLLLRPKGKVYRAKNRLD